MTPTAPDTGEALIMKQTPTVRPPNNARVANLCAERYDTACCAEPACGSGLRNRYFSGKRLSVDAFRVEQDYLIGRRRLLNRALHGWGVVCGYGVAAAPPVAGQYQRPSGRLTITPGLALDQAGRELLSENPTELGYGDVIALDQRGKPVRASSDGDPHEWSDDELKAGRWLLAVHYAERAIDPVSAKGLCGSERCEHEHVCETVRYTLSPIDCGDCCKDAADKLECGCDDGPWCADAGKALPPVDRPPLQQSEAGTRNPVARGGCRCLCEDAIGMNPNADCNQPCGRVREDLENKVPLACVRLARDDCNRLTFGPEVEACGPRRLVQRTDVLFDLIRGGDLTRIAWMSWAPWHRGVVPFDTFAASFQGGEIASGTRTTLRLGFSRPVVTETLRADCFVMTVTFREKKGAREAIRVPIVNVETNDDNGFATEAALVVRTSWVKAIFGGATPFDSVNARAELEVRGDYIVDCNGLAVDANAIGLNAAPSGNGTPGGTHLSTFEVLSRTLLPDDTNE